MLFGLVQNETSFDRIVEQHQSMVYSLAYHFLRNASLAEELAQDVFLQLHRNIGALESPAHVKRWLRKVTSHRSIDQTRRLKLAPRLGLADVPEPSTPPSPTDHLLNGRLERLLDQLPANARIVMILRYQEDLDPTDISETLAMPVATVKSHLHRSLEFLREKLKGVN
jgi:RNA polymerase sigma-70 factor (ECF subfamily)